MSAETPLELILARNLLSNISTPAFLVGACATVYPPSYGVHLELYADRLVLPVPSGIGVAPPQQRRQPLSAGSLAGFDGPAVAFLGGRRWSGSPQAIPLCRHAEIVLQVGGELPPHPAYLFPPGL
jgi:hypothetical protein